MMRKQNYIMVSWLILAVGNSPAWGAAPTDTAKGSNPAIYTPVGKRDPFRQPVGEQERELSSLSPLERYNLEQLQLRAILRGIGKSRAMFEDPEGKTHIVTEGEIIGRERGTISRILNTDVIVTERTFNYLGVESLYEKVISLPKEEEVSGVSSGAATADHGNANAVANQNFVPAPTVDQRNINTFDPSKFPTGLGQMPATINTDGPPRIEAAPAEESRVRIVSPLGTENK